MKLINFCSIIFTMFLFSISVLTQTPPANEDVVKISTTLIQIDATVTDKKGSIIKDLKPEDFEVYENGKKQDITNFSFIFTTPENPPAEIKNTSKSDNKTSNLPPPTTAKLKPEQVKRTFTLVVDDLGLSFSSVFWVKDALKRFVNEKMQDGDLVAVLRVSGGIGALQSFTSDKRQLLAAIDKVRWNGQGRVGINSYEPIGTTLAEDISGTKKPDGSIKTVAGMQESKQSAMQAEAARQSNFAVGTVGALRYVIRGMRELPGRKSLMLFSEGFQMFDYSKVASGKSSMPEITRITDELRNLADLANRSSVVIYTLDPRGLTIPADIPDAQDKVNGGTPNPGSSNRDLEIRGNSIRDSQDSLRYLARETGGVAYIDQNDMNSGIKKALDDQKGYYLIGYQPDSETFDANKSKFNTLSIKLKRPGLKVRYRSGFFGVTDENLKQENVTPRQKLLTALLSPFGANDITLNTYSLFYNDFRNRNIIRSLVYIDANDLTFTLDNDGFYRTKFEIIASIFDSNGASADNDITTTTLQFNKEKFAKIQKEGIVYNLVIPIVKKGAFQFRIALRDLATGKIGSASQFVEIPNLDKKNLALSNLIVRNYSLQEWKNIKNQTDAANDNKVYLDTSLRQFKRGTILTYNGILYNAKIDSSQQPRIQLQTRLFQNGKKILESNPQTVTLGEQKDLQRIDISNAITLGTDLSPGDYVMQIIVSDNAVKDKNKIAAQSIDFQIVE